MIDFLKQSFIRPVSKLEKPRIEFFDLAKGICIILVVIFHSDLALDTPNFEALRMPLYFMLSGIFFRDYGGVKYLVVKKLNKLLTPFVVFYLLSFMIIYLANYFLREGVIPFSRILDPLYSAAPVNISLWFLLSLFWCNCIYCLIHVLLKSCLKRIIAVVIMTSVGLLLGYHKIALPLYIGSALISLPFFYGGVALGNVKLLFPNRYDKYSIFLALFFLIISYSIYYTSDEKPIMTILCCSWTGNIILGYINSVCMVLGVLLICKTIVWLPLISYIGRYSIVVLIWSSLILANIAEVVELLLCVYMSPLECFMYTIIICWLLIPVMRKYFPYITAQKDWLKLGVK